MKTTLNKMKIYDRKVHKFVLHINQEGRLMVYKFHFNNYALTNKFKIHCTSHPLALNLFLF